jgi:iron complex transport system ATP-binding protein
MDTIKLSGLKIGYRATKDKSKQVGPLVNFEASKGELVALIGPNGIGKSTLLRTIIRLQPALSGKILINNKSHDDINSEEFSTLLSFVSTEPVRISNMTVSKLIALGRFPYTNWLGKINDSDKEFINEALELVNLIELKDAPVNEISDGERQRAMIARALAQNTPIILLDEPTAFLDLINKYELIHLLLNLVRTKQKTIIFSTHELNIALSEVDKIWLMNHTEVKQGAPEDLVLDNSFSGLIGKKLEFNWQSGTFKQIKIYDRSLGLECEQGILNDQVVRALNRIGISTDKNAARKIFVSSRGKENSFIVQESNKQTEFKSIYELCKYLKND